MNINIAQLVGQITDIIQQVVSIGLLLAIAASLAGFYGLRLPMVPKVDPQPLAWLSGAFWLWRGGRP